MISSSAAKITNAFVIELCRTTWSRLPKATTFDGISISIRSATPNTITPITLANYFFARVLVMMQAPGTVMLHRGAAFIHDALPFKL
jgi:hypothetical protein